MLLKCWTQYVSKFGKLSSGHKTGKCQFSFQSQRRAVKEHPNYCTVALVSHTGKAVLRIFPARLRQYVNWGLPDILAGFRKGRGTRNQIASILWILEKTREFQKNIDFYFIDYTKAFDCVGHNKPWKILKQMGIPEHLTCLLRKLYAGQEATARTGHGTTDWFKTGKGVWKGYILSSCLFNFLQSTSCKMPGWMNHKLDSRLPAKITTSDMQMIPLEWKWRGNKEPLDEDK